MAVLKSLIATLMLSALLAVAYPASAGAYTIEKNDDQVTGQYTISPTKYELEVDPGDSLARDVMIANRTGQTLTIEFTTEDFEGSSNPAEATVFLGEEDSAWGARHWLDPEVGSIVLQQGETLTMQVKIEVPANAEPGGHYASLFASTTIEGQDEKGSAISLTSRLGCLFLIRVSGDITEEGSLNTPEVSGFLEKGPVQIGLTFNNSGNVHLKPSGRILITNFLGQTVAEIPVKEWIVLPDASRRTAVDWDTGYHFGRYTVTAEINYGEEQVPLVMSRSFWMIPWKIVLGGSVGLVLVVTLTTVLLRRRRSVRRELESEIEQLRSQGATDQAGPAEHVALNELFPSMEDSQLIDLSDPETQRLVRELIDQQLDLSRTLIGQGEIESARRELLEARAAAQRAGLLSSLGVIDDLLRGM